MKIVTIIGARPQFIKAKPVLDELKRNNAMNPTNAINSVVVHTGQHYDYEMSRLFFDELDIPKPDYNLGVGSGEHGLQTGYMLIKIEEVLQKEKPDLVLVYGDTNSTLAGALAAAKLNIHVAHIEAGMRSFNRDMPEEVNRVLTDHISNLLFCSTQTAVDNLRNEGITENVFLVGDVMYEAAIKNITIAEQKSDILATYDLRPKSYYLATVHRPSNTDNLQNLSSILETFSCLDLPVVFPLHPRTKKVMKQLSNIAIEQYNNILFIEPVGYLDMLNLEKNAKKILTDSGGVQKEAYFFEVPCITLREETEWIETVKSGWNVLVGSDKERIANAIKKDMPKVHIDTFFGNGKASEKICRIIEEFAGR